MDVRVGLWGKLSTEKLMLLNYGVDSWEFLGLQGDPTSPSHRKSVLGVHWKDWCWSWSCNTLATSCEELTHWKRPWCWEGLGKGREGEDRGWDGWMASPTWWAWVWVDSGSWWRTGRPGVLQFMRSQSQRRLSDWTELNWTEGDANGKESAYQCRRCKRLGFPGCGRSPRVGMTTHFAWRIPWTEEPGRLQSMGLDATERTHRHTHTHTHTHTVKSDM